MPVMDGFTATRRLRENPEWRSLPIIALTANAMVEDKERCLASGMNGHLAKPIRMEALYEQLARCVPDTWKESEDAPSSSVAPSLKQSELPRFPGIDTALGLAHVGGQLPQFFRILKLLRDDQGRKFAGQIVEALAGCEWETAERLAHSLKGVAHTLGALDLGDAARTLENAAKRRDAEQCAELVPQVVALLHQVTVGLGDLERLLEETKPLNRITDSFMSASEPMLAKLAELLAVGDPMAIDLALDLAPGFIATVHRPTWEAVALLIEQYDFAAAAAALELLRHTLTEVSP